MSRLLDRSDFRRAIAMCSLVIVGQFGKPDNDGNTLEVAQLCAEAKWEVVSAARCDSHISHKTGALCSGGTAQGERGISVLDEERRRLVQPQRSSPNSDSAPSIDTR